MWAECVLPSLFPFMVISLIAIKSGFAEKAALPLKKITGVFALPPAAAVLFLISVCSGYPAGAKAVSEFYESGRIDEKDASKLAAICSTSGPLFILGSVGAKMLKDGDAAKTIFIAHMLSVLVSGLIIAAWRRKKTVKEFRPAPKESDVLYKCFSGAVTAVLVAGGFIAFFAVAAQAIADFNLLLPLEKFLCLFLDNESAAAVTKGIIEVTTGCLALSACDSPLKVPLTGFLVTFGGVSILLQQLCYFSKAGTGAVYFVGVKFLQGIICFLLLLPFCQ